MEIEKYISELLYRYDCVIIPDFGGFVTNKKSAQLNAQTQTIYPPYKQLSFNSNLKHNDGLLANYIATSENISYEKANLAISMAVIKWQHTIQKSTLRLQNLGDFHLNEQQLLVFEPKTMVNYLTSSFGFAPVVTSKYESKTVVKPLPQTQKPNYVAQVAKYAAAAVVVVSLGFYGIRNYQTQQQNKWIAKQQKAVETKIQQATFAIPNPLPVLEITVEKPVEKPYHIIAGAFEFEENAQKKLEELIDLGYPSAIIGKNKWGLTQVTFGSFEDKNEAINTLYKIQKTVSADAWLLIK